jgi:hypothetical protein
MTIPRERDTSRQFDGANPQPSDWEPHPSGDFAASRTSLLPLDGGNIFVRQDGLREGPALVLIHGLAASTRWWDPLVPLLTTSHRVINVTAGIANSTSDRRYFLFGAVVFFVFQLLTRLPALRVLDPIVTPHLASSTALTWIWLLGLSLSAAVFEEVGRYVGYRVFMRREQKTWAKAVMYGLGHGGLESMLLVGGTALLTLIGLLSIQSGGLEPWKLDGLGSDRLDLLGCHRALRRGQWDYSPCG